MEHVHLQKILVYESCAAKMCLLGNALLIFYQKLVTVYKLVPSVRSWYQLTTNSGTKKLKSCHLKDTFLQHLTQISPKCESKTC